MTVEATFRSDGPTARRGRVLRALRRAALPVWLALLAACAAGTDPRAFFDDERYERSLALATSLAERDDAAAANLVGLHYYLGLGTARDFAAAGRWFERAARLGDAAAQRNLATLYLRGLGVRQDDFLAFAWFSESARRGNARATHYLDTMRDALTPSEIVRARRVLAKELNQRIGH